MKVRIAVRIAFVPPWKFYGRKWYNYILPKRITLKVPGRLRVYRWVTWNIAIGEEEKKNYAL